MSPGWWESGGVRTMCIELHMLIYLMTNPSVACFDTGHRRSRGCCKHINRRDVVSISKYDRVLECSCEGYY